MLTGRLSPAILGLGVLAALTGVPASAGELDGRWRNGSWTDTKTGHEDVLRARFHQRSDGNYRVVFTGRFAKVIPFRFATTLNVVGRDGDKVIMQGDPRIPGFGRFSYHAVADGNNFNAQVIQSDGRVNSTCGVSILR